MWLADWLYSFLLILIKINCYGVAINLPNESLILSLTAHLMLLISLQSYKLPPKKDDMCIYDDSDVKGADL